MKNKYIFLLLLQCIFSIAYSQEKILLFDYDEVYPQTSSWADMMQPELNPAPDDVNNSQLVGLFVHNAQWSEIEINSDELGLDARYYNTVELKAFIPSNMPDGKVHITCKGLGTSRESRRRYDTYEIAPPVKGKWFNIQHSFYGAYPIGLVQIGYRRSEVPNPSEDIAYFDDLSFHKTTSTDICLYRESFCIVYPENENADFIGNPSQRAGNWVGNVDLTSTGNIVLVKYPNTNSHVMQMLTTGADIVFPGITNLDGYENLRVVFDTRWKVDETKRAAFNNATPETKSPGIKVKSGNESWTNLATQPFSDTWQTQSITIAPSGAQNVSLSFGKGNSNFDFEIDNVMIFGTPKTSGLNDLSAIDLKFYPNPVKEVLYTSQDVERMEILNLQGQLMVSRTGHSISMSNLTSGLYFVKVYKGGKVFVSKILKD
ncbi:MAG: T9SS type A sorting domain-containing protein [Bacteroidota bacterium]|nr:T9SS type A sorting domain-containing protein [Bacteroidota bacterium]